MKVDIKLSLLPEAKFKQSSQIYRQKMKLDKLWNLTSSAVLGISRKIAPLYRVILHNGNFNKWEYVVRVLMKVIPGMTLDNAVNIMQEAHYNGLSEIIITPNLMPKSTAWNCGEMGF
ncbi:hypothetical protein UlMin_014329 [Ulmus minor]